MRRLIFAVALSALCGMAVGGEFNKLPYPIKEALFSVSVQAQGNINDKGVSPAGIPVGQFKEESARCTFVLNYEAARNINRDEIGRKYYMSGGAYSASAPQGGEELLKHVVLFVKLFGNKFGAHGEVIDEAYIDQIVKRCEASLQKNKDFFNQFAGKYSIH